MMIKTVEDVKGFEVHIVNTLNHPEYDPSDSLGIVSDDKDIWDRMPRWAMWLLFGLAISMMVFGYGLMFYCMERL